MDIGKLSVKEKTALITKAVIKVLEKVSTIPIGVSNRHIHLSRQDMDVLFGTGSELRQTKALRQPGQYACEQTVQLKGPKGSLSKVRVLGPLRPDTQVEISVTDGFTLGVNPPVRESGHIENSAGIEIIGPRGTVHKDSGVIAALRHIHMTTEDAGLFGLSDKDYVSVTVGSGVRRATLHNVLVRVSDSYALEMHLDVDEANGVGAKNGDCAVISEVYS